MKPNDTTKYLYTVYFAPGEKADDLAFTDGPANAEKKKYSDWRDEGLCHIVKGGVIPDDYVAKFLRNEIYEKYGIRPYRAGYDNWHAKEFVKIISDHYGKHVPVAISMTPAALDFGTRELENDLRANRANYNQNAMCIWNFRNAALRYDGTGRCMPIKLQGYIGNKIDGTMSKVIAYTTLRHVKAAFMAKVG